MNCHKLVQHISLEIALREFYFLKLPYKAKI